ncbi:hypothetical protein AKJ42_02190 [candidate division MSBL1 archaeon SCGC-AAA261C02]|uniref:Uncharacterized protein n=1 Tax=candidate division MSBL1 archaeon SCGC-AAA261C02 TaxID=1698272 RepID=A0A133V0F2_9EURY|nr:hypothetical protein AKJ42_02190 [candidate division MSBL1 archaeon SCGC-AAA261C02]
MNSTKYHLYSVHMISEDEGWAVGLEGTILHYKKKPEQLEGPPALSLWIMLLIIPLTISIFAGFLYWKKSSGK